MPPHTGPCLDCCEHTRWSISLDFSHQHAARPPSLSINRGCTEELIEILLTALYTNSWPLIPIIPAYRVVINHSQPCKYKSFHLSLRHPENNCCILPWEVFPGMRFGGGAAALGTLMCSYSGSARGGSFRECASLPCRWRRLIRPLQPRSDKTLERLDFRLQASNFRLADVQRAGRLTGVWRFTERNGACLFAFHSASRKMFFFFWLFESARFGRGTNRDREWIFFFNENGRVAVALQRKMLCVCICSLIIRDVSRFFE